MPGRMLGRMLGRMPGRMLGRMPGRMPGRMLGNVGSMGGVGNVGSVGSVGGVGGVGSVGGTGSAARYHAARASPGSNPYGVAFIRKACVCKACALYVFARVARPRYCARHTSHVRLRRAHDFASF